MVTSHNRRFRAGNNEAYNNFIREEAQISTLRNELEPYVPRSLGRSIKADIYSIRNNKVIVPSRKSEDWEKMLFDMQEADDDENKRERDYEKFLGSRKALKSEDPLIREHARTLRLKGTKPSLYVQLEGENKFTDFEKLADKFNFPKLPSRIIDDAYDYQENKEPAKKLISSWNEAPESWGQKIKSAKIKFKDPYTQEVKGYEEDVV